ncbi:hypothetical protein QWT69_16135 [Sporosarcina oncorhynchi]|uniref:Uncharacterized protein n=1 Tax=Sporosarcina oncorhynchi TaxID=3056444 RepID=A0ABZ0L6R8_9BACL|nr:hypothetical protein [Sporosarcina sp. T2O-4]WOV87357.1 hypothetical protein QWT69_16135 [Sporosarcina sp. T2O-4]
MQMKKGLHQLDASHTFLSIGMGSIGLFPILLAIIPTLVAKTLHETRTTLLVQVPKEAYFLYGIGLVLLTITSFLLYFLKINKKAKMISAAIGLLVLLCFVDASQRYVRVATDSVAFKSSMLSKEYVYTWEEVEKVVFRELPKEGGFAKFDFHFNDGNIMILANDNYMMRYRKLLEKKFSDDGIEYKRG